jgi:signal transduction histidine kinase/FixJ family two-component response regulator
MKYRFSYFFWILLLALGLMLVILAAQIFTSRNINGLKAGNKEAAITFTINNSLQEIVNISFALEARLSRNLSGKPEFSPLKDSLTVIGYNASVLQKLNLDTETSRLFTELNYFIRRQVALSYKSIDAIETGNTILKNQLTDSLLRLGLSDSIYNTAVIIGKQLEKKLQATLNQNTEASRKLSDLNKILALVAIAAILILGTIIINRHLRQLQLIRDLEKASDEVHKSAMIKEQFLANMSHEIRTPLNAIKGFSRLMLQTPLTTEQKQYADIMQSSSNTLLQLVNDILDISKIEAGKMVIEKKEFDLFKLLQTLEFMFGNAASEKELQFSCVATNSVPQYLVGDEDRLYQVLINLVSNAIKFTSNGFVSVSVSPLNEKTEGLWLEFNVADSGIGIAPDKQQVVFERFHQVNDNAEAPQQGTGLGLAIVKNLSVLMGGDVIVKSRQGEGSVFTVRLPLDRITDEKLPGVETEPKKAPDIRFSKAAILVAEDNKVNQLLVLHMLQEYGIDPVFRENGSEVMELLSKGSFDLLLLDIQMPVMDGYKTIQEIRGKDISMPVVAMTAYVMPGEKEKCLAAGMNDYLAKPIEEQELQAVLMKYLSKHIVMSAFPGKDETRNEFLLNLAGGDKKMAILILNEVKQQLPGEINKLQQVISTGDTGDLPTICHHLLSTISPLGDNTDTVNKIASIQQALLENKETEKVIHLAEELKNDLDFFYCNINTE